MATKNIVPRANNEGGIGTASKKWGYGGFNEATVNVITAGLSEVVKPTTGDLTADECRGTIINNYGQTSANTQTLPAAAEGLSGIVVIGTPGFGAFNLKAGAGDKIYLDGVALTDGNKATLASPIMGDTFSFFAFQTGAASWDWIVNSGIGILADGGA